MAQMSLENWQLYNVAHNLWKAGRFHDVQNILEELEERGAFTVSKVVLLAAYNRRSLGRMISEVEILEELVDRGCQDEPELLATVHSMLGQAYSVLGKAAKAVEEYIIASKMEENSRQRLVEYSNAIFTAAAVPDTDRDFWKYLYDGYERLLAQWKHGGVEVTDDSQKHNRMEREKKTTKGFSSARIRIGYLSGDYHQHPVASLLWPLIDKADRKCFQIFCYYGGTTYDNVTSKFMRKADVWRQVAEMNDQEIAQVIRNDGIDILVDLGGHTSDNMLPVLALKPARVQISAIGWVGSTGMKEVDYVLGDEFCAPQEQQETYLEKMLSIRGSHFCFHIFGEMPAVAEMPFLHNGYITFGCFNNFSKVTDEMLVAWGEILQLVPNSRLLLKHKLFADVESKKYTLDRLMKCGIEKNRVELREFSADYLNQYGDMDIALDTYPYTGGMTTFEALYMGVPVISRYGESRGQRFGYSMLKNVGLEMLTCCDLDDYIKVAVAMARNPKLMENVRKRLRSMVECSPLMDEAGYTKKVECLYHSIYKGPIN